VVPPRWATRFLLLTSRDAATAAVAVYLKPDDPPRVTIPFDVSNAALCDLRDLDTCATLGIDLNTPSVLWVRQRAQVQLAGSPQEFRA